MKTLSIVIAMAWSLIIPMLVPQRIRIPKIAVTQLGYRR